eukprot:IDg21923t1
MKERKAAQLKEKSTLSTFVVPRFGAYPQGSTWTVARTVLAKTLP